VPGFSAGGDRAASAEQFHGEIALERCDVENSYGVPTDAKKA
jgi:hypothetical protein